MNKSSNVAIDIITQVASRKGIEPLELDEPLENVLDTDALDVLVSGKNGQRPENDLRIRFWYQGYLVTVEGPTEVVIEERVPADEEIGTNPT